MRDLRNLSALRLRAAATVPFSAMLSVVIVAAAFIWVVFFYFAVSAPNPWLVRGGARPGAIPVLRRRPEAPCHHAARHAGVTSMCARFELAKGS